LVPKVLEIWKKILIFIAMAGSIKEQGQPTSGGAGTANGYVTSAEGEPLP
jgi:hypothetical protein